MESLKEEETTSKFSETYHEHLKAFTSLAADIKKKVKFDEILRIVS